MSESLPHFMSDIKEQSSNAVEEKRERLRELYTLIVAFGELDNVWLHTSFQNTSFIF